MIRNEVLTHRSSKRHKSIENKLKVDIAKTLLDLLYSDACESEEMQKYIESLLFDRKLSTTVHQLLD